MKIQGKTPWENLYFNWIDRDNFILELERFLNNYKIKYKVWNEEPKNILILFGDLGNIKNTNFCQFFGYDSAGILHIGSIMPVLTTNIIKESFELPINKSIVSINDLEAISSRATSIKKSKYNILRIITVFKNIEKYYPTLLPNPVYVIRSKKKYILLNIGYLLNRGIEDFIEEIYGDIPLRHVFSSLVMMGEILHWNKKYNIVTAYGIEEFLHLLLYYQLKRRLKLKNKFISVIFLPIEGKIKGKKMSKSESETSIFLLKSEIREIEQYPNIREQLEEINKKIPINIFKFLKDISLYE